MLRALVPVLIGLLLLAPLASHAEGIREAHPNLVYGEIGGKSIIFCPGYERYVNNRLGLGIGAVGWGGSGGGVGLFPLYVALHPIGDIHSLYLSTGITYIAGVGNWDDSWSTWIVNMLYKGEGFVVIPGIALGGSF
jgi:hypothetical protein